MAGARLSRGDWVEAGLAALSRGGPDAVAVEPIATGLGATKGSGYWHFGSRQDLLDAVLERWLDEATERVIVEVESGGGTPRARLLRLMTRVTAAIEEHPGDLLTLGHADPHVRAAVRRATARRIDYLTDLVVGAGVEQAEARRRAVLAYTCYVGVGQLAVTAPEVLPGAAPDRAALLHRIADAVLPG